MLFRSGVALGKLINKTAFFELLVVESFSRGSATSVEWPTRCTLHANALFLSSRKPLKMTINQAVAGIVVLPHAYADH